MGVPTSDVGYIPAMLRREDHEVHKGHVVALEKKTLISRISNAYYMELPFSAVTVKYCTHSCNF